MKPTTTKRTPTAEERKRWQAAIAETDVDLERRFWNPIVDQLRGQADIDSAIDLLKTVRESQGISLRTHEESAGIPRGNISSLHAQCKVVDAWSSSLRSIFDFSSRFLENFLALLPPNSKFFSWL